MSVPRLEIPGARWRADPAPDAEGLLALLNSLDHSQWWNAAQIREHQHRKLDELLRHAFDTVPYYRQRVQPAGHVPGTSPAREILQRLPVVSRRDLQDAAPLLKSQRCPPEHGRIYQGQTGGSSGAPLKFLTTDRALTFWEALTLRDHLWHGRDFSGKLAAIRGHTGLAAGSTWGSPVDKLFESGPHATQNIRTPDAQLFEWLLEQNPDYLVARPWNVRSLALRSLRESRMPSKLREIRTYGEVLLPNLRALCRDAWSAAVTDIYSAEEVGYIALQCPGHEHYHVQSESVVVEILDDEGTPCAPGQTGRVVITALHNFALPLIRYEIGDYAEAGGHCACGRGLPVISRIVGRWRNALILPDGGRRWPALVVEQICGDAPVREFQAVQTGHGAIEARIVADRTLSDDERRRMAAALKHSLDYECRISFNQVTEIPRTGSYKYEPFVSELDS